LAVLYTRKGIVGFVLFCGTLIAIIMTAHDAAIGAITGVEILSTFILAFVFGASIALPVSLCQYRFRGSIYRPVEPKPPKKLTATRNQTVLEAEQHRLTEFNLEEIHNLHELTRINLGLNQIKSIDLSPIAGSTNLKELVLYMNHLETIDLTPLESCPNLEYLDLTDNNLENIDLTPLASCFKLNALNIGINKTSQIDLSPLSECRDLKILTIDGMNLKEIDLSPLSDCIKLEFLKVEDEELKSIDITPLFGCRALTNFAIGRMELTTTLNRVIGDWPKGIQKHRRKIRITNVA